MPEPSRSKRPTAGLEVEPEHEHARKWYEALALLDAGERHVQNKNLSNALEAYRASVERFRASIDSRSEYEESASHYICLALSAVARVHTDGGEWPAAIAALREGVAASPGSVWKSDGLGNSPRDTALLLYGSLVDAGKDAEAQSLRAFLTEQGVKIQG